MVYLTLGSLACAPLYKYLSKWGQSLLHLNPWVCCILMYSNIYQFKSNTRTNVKPGQIFSCTNSFFDTKMHSTELFAQTAKYLFHIWPNANIKLDCCTDRSSEGDKMYWVTGKSAKSGSQWNLEFSRVQETDRKLTNSFLSHLAFEIGINAGNHPENNPKK